jgi:hypothetical protein
MPASLSLSTASPREILLLDDNLTAISVLCKTSHMQTTNISTTMETADLVTLALLADGYDAIHILRPWEQHDV